ncbi:MAG: thermonuclease family protein [Rhodobacteraceae bacterium]|nr:thermonuclease family protein [Paracoccaceae bacterium]
MAKVTLGILGITALFIAACVPDSRVSNGVSGISEACTITHIVDGDTLDLKCAGGPVERIRIMGYDTPETYFAECPAEKRLGDTATNRLRQLAATTSVTRVERHGLDRYQRVLARIWLGGTDLAQTMVSENLAVPYNGGRRIRWCDRLANSGNN